MNRFAYRIFGWLGACMRVFPRRNKALFFMIHECHFRGNLRYLYEECGRSDPTIKRVVLSKKALLKTKHDGLFGVLERVLRSMIFAVRVNYHLATSSYILLNDNFLPLAYLKFPKEVRLVQLWHGAGAFKRFGLVVEKDPLVRELVAKGNARVDYMPVTAESLKPIYAEAMGIPKERICADGIPLLDFYYEPARQKVAKEHVLRKYPQLTGKKVVFYAPTLRKSQEENDAIPKHFDAERLLRELPGEVALLVRFHPNVRPSCIPWEGANIIDATNYPDVKELLVSADMLITDYSSVAVEYSLLNRPLYFYMYDYPKDGVWDENAVRYDRGMYLDASAFPGGYAVTMEELTEMCGNEACGLENARYFYEHNFDCAEAPGYSERIWRKIRTEMVANG